MNAGTDKLLGFPNHSSYCMQKGQEQIFYSFVRPLVLCQTSFDVIQYKIEDFC